MKDNYPDTEPAQFQQDKAVAQRGVVPEDEALARLIAVALGFLVDTFPDQVKHLTKSDCFRAADAVLKAGYHKQEHVSR